MEKLKITLYSVDNGIRSAIRTAFTGAGYIVTEITDSSKLPRADINEKQQPGTFGRLNLPHKVDAVISTAALNRKTEGLAASLALKQNRNDVYPIVLPEAFDFLRARLANFGELTLVGADQAK